MKLFCQSMIVLSDYLLSIHVMRENKRLKLFGDKWLAICFGRDVYNVIFLIRVTFIII